MANAASRLPRRPLGLTSLPRFGSVVWQKAFSYPLGDFRGEQGENVVQGDAVRVGGLLLECRQSGVVTA